MTFGEILFYGGISTAGIGGIALIVGTIAFGVKRSKLRKKLYDRYGF